MSRNCTEYHVLMRNGDYDPVKTCRTLKQAMSVVAAMGAEQVYKWKSTPSKKSMRIWHPMKPRVQTISQIIRKKARLEADARRINSRRTTRIYMGGDKWQDKKISDWGWFRHVIGVRKGTIL